MLLSIYKLKNSDWIDSRPLSSLSSNFFQTTIQKGIHVSNHGSFLKFFNFSNADASYLKEKKKKEEERWKRFVRLS